MTKHPAPETDSNSDQNTQKSQNSSEKGKWPKAVFWIVVIGIALPAYMTPGSLWAVWMAFVILVAGIWIHPSQGEGWLGKSLRNRIQHYTVHKMRIGLSIGAFLFAILVFSSQLMQEATQKKVLAEQETLRIELQAKQEQEAQLALEAGIVPVEYEIVKVEDLSRKIMTKPLGEYTAVEMEALPTNKKMLYRIVVSSQIQENQVKPTVHKIIGDIVQADRDIDEIGMFLYSDRQKVEEGGIYDVAKVTWAPFGKMGNVTAEIAQSNLRINYQTTLEIEKGLDEYLSQRNKSEEKLGLSEELRREIFMEMIRAGDRAEKESQAQYPAVDPSLPNSKELVLERFNKQDELRKSLQETYEGEVRARYGIDEAAAGEIEHEALEEKWTLPAY